MTFRHLGECFGCSTENAASLGIQVAADDSGARATVRFGREHQGPPGLVHGGLLATLLDETMGTVPVEVTGIRLTVEMAVRYRRPTPIDTDLVCRAHVAEISARGFSVAGTITTVDEEDVVLVEGSASYVFAPAKDS